ncbi:MAG: DUF1566 domain-containing protein [Pseudomonadota bacterium]|nr:DUF1566 domain-containing protein [Pseudomonadota bacterium]
MKTLLIPVAVATALLATTAQAACPSVPTAQRFSISADGTEVTDKQTKLIWRRCSEGQSWSGTTCTGTATTMAHEAALKLARDQGPWRLPDVDELNSLADKGCKNPAIDATAFPGTLSDWYWSSSPLVGLAGSAWVVLFYDGSVLFSDNAAVRLVRASQ